MEKDIFDLYVLSELCYKKKHPGMSDEELFPHDWYSFLNYRTKIDVIAEALKNNILIEQTKKYQEIREGVKESL